jgi:hypothetical protein
MNKHKSKKYKTNKNKSKKYKFNKNKSKKYNGGSAFNNLASITSKQLLDKIILYFKDKDILINESKINNEKIISKIDDIKKDAIKKELITKINGLIASDQTNILNVIKCLHLEMDEILFDLFPNAKLCNFIIDTLKQNFTSLKIKAELRLKISLELNDAFIEQLLYIKDKNLYQKENIIKLLLLVSKFNYNSLFKLDTITSGNPDIFNHIISNLKLRFTDLDFTFQEKQALSLLLSEEFVSDIRTLLDETLPPEDKNIKLLLLIGNYDYGLLFKLNTIMNYDTEDVIDKIISNLRIQFPTLKITYSEQMVVTLLVSEEFISNIRKLLTERLNSEENMFNLLFIIIKYDYDKLFKLDTIMNSTKYFVIDKIFNTLKLGKGYSKIITIYKIAITYFISDEIIRVNEEGFSVLQHMRIENEYYDTIFSDQYIKKIYDKYNK